MYALHRIYLQEQVQTGLVLSAFVIGLYLSCSFLVQRRLVQYLPTQKRWSPDEITYAVTLSQSLVATGSLLLIIFFKNGESAVLAVVLSLHGGYCFHRAIKIDVLGGP